MSSRSNFIKIALSVVLFMLVLVVAFSFISTSQAIAAETDVDSRVAQLEQMIAQLRQENAALIITNSQLSQQVAQLQAELNAEYVLVLRHEDVVLSGLFGDSIVVNTRIQEISVGKAMFDSCQIGDDITSTQLHRLLAPGNISQTRVIVEDKIPPE